MINQETWARDKRKLFWLAPLWIFTFVYLVTMITAFFPIWSLYLYFNYAGFSVLDSAIFSGVVNIFCVLICVTSAHHTIKTLIKYDYNKFGNHANKFFFDQIGIWVIFIIIFCLVAFFTIKGY